MKNSILNAQRKSIDPDSGALHFVQMTIGDPIFASWMDRAEVNVRISFVISITAFYVRSAFTVQLLELLLR